MSETVDVTVKLKRPPEGMEYEIVPRGHDHEAQFVAFRLRPIQPATVMVEMTREDVGFRAKVCGLHGLQISLCDSSIQSCRESAAARAALARKPESKLCPVMVCNQSGAMKKCTHSDYFDHFRAARRPCKLEAGHGGAHE